MTTRDPITEAWARLFIGRCPHGCDATCGCATGWLPEVTP